LTSWLWIAAAVIGLAHIVGGVTAFGSTLFSMALLIALDGTDRLGEYVPALAVCGLLQAGWIALHERRSVVWPRLGVVLLLMGLGLPLGRYGATAFASIYIHLLLGGVLIAGGVSAGRSPSRQPRPWPAWVSVPVLLGAGLVHGALASGGALLIPYLKHAEHRRDRFRGTLSAAWVGLNLLLLVLWLAPDPTADASAATARPHALFVLAAAAAALIGTYVGQALAKRLNDRRFAYAAAGCMVVAGLVHILLSIT